MTVVRRSIFYTSLASAVLLAVYVAVITPLNHDLGWLIRSTAAWLNGATLYVDILEPNPPLIFIITAPLVWLRDFTHLTTIAAAKIYFGIIAVGATLFHLFLARHVFARHNLWPMYAVATIVISLVLPYSHFGQRDHLIILFLLPYVLTRYLDTFGLPRTRVSRIAAGVLAGIAIGLKPHYLLLLLASELWAIRLRRSWRSLLNLQLGAAGTILVAFTAYLVLYSSYLTELVPLAVATYRAYTYVPLANYNLGYLIVFWLALVVLGNRLKDSKQRALLTLFHVLSLAGLVVFLLQAHLAYHLLPFLTTVLLSGVLIALYYQQQSPFARQIINYGGLNLVLLLLAVFMIHGDLLGRLASERRLPTLTEQGYPAREEAVQILNQHAANQSIYALSTNVLLANLVAEYSAAHWISIYGIHWPLPAIDAAERWPERLSNRQQEQIQDARSKVFSGISRELAEHNPTVIIVEEARKNRFLQTGFNYGDFIERTPELKALLANYETSPVHFSLNGQDSYRLYFRQDLPGNGPQLIK